MAGSGHFNPRSLQLRAILAEQGMSLGDLAEKVGKHQASLTRLLQGHSDQWIAKVARIAGVSTDFLLGLTDDPTPYWQGDLQP